MFITMGWMGALLALAILKFVGWGGVALVAAGGVAYSVRRAAPHWPLRNTPSLTHVHAHRPGGGCISPSSQTRCRAALASTRRA